MRRGDHGMARIGRQERRGGGIAVGEVIAGRISRMTDGDLLGEAVAELYSSDPDEFVERRGALVARGRGAGEAAAARQPAPRPTPPRSAWVVNRLVRADPGVTAELAELGE